MPGRSRGWPRPEPWTPASVRPSRRPLAAFQVVTTDALIAIYHAKYEYARGRLVTAIREGSPGVTPDPTWTPLFTTPLHPEYPSGHGGYAGAAQAILTAFFGPVAPASVSATSPTEDVSSLWGWLAATGVALFTSLAVPGPSSNGFRQLLLRTWPLSPAHVEESGQREA